MMRKGDVKRQQLLNESERLFCRYGYDKTSVQDILDAAGLSKGGFYHHFTSKEEVLTELCDRRAQRAAAFAAERVKTAESPVGRINAVLYGFMPLRRDEDEFVGLLLPVIAKPEGRAIAMTYQDALEAQFLPLLQAEVEAAAAKQAVFPMVKDIERVVLNIVNHCWMAIAAQLNDSLLTSGRIDQMVLVTTLEKYRRAVEVLLDAPYGTIEILRVEELAEVINAIC
ncbi:MAG: TetR/AcrR family transcriptional regulator [Clostridia bacterium]|nr:TetR/AcrR family transcriptional regulator [Clostridia bacterium]